MMLHRKLHKPAALAAAVKLAIWLTGAAVMPRPAAVAAVCLLRTAAVAAGCAPLTCRQVSV